MDRNQIICKLNTIFQNIFDDNSISLTDETCSDDIEEWDSLEQINLIESIQDSFKIKFNFSEVYSIRNVGEIVDQIVKKVED